jgi:hypothetical protein
VADGWPPDLLDARMLPESHPWDPDQPLLRARVIGGCSSDNAAYLTWGPERDYDEWEAAGANRWGWRAIEPYLVRARAAMGARALDDEELGPWALAAAAAEEQSGMPVPGDLSEPGSVEGVGPNPVNIAGSVRWDARSPISTTHAGATTWPCSATRSPTASSSTAAGNLLPRDRDVSSGARGGRRRGRSRRTVPRTRGPLRRRCLEAPLAAARQHPSEYPGDRRDDRRRTEGDRPMSESDSAEALRETIARYNEAWNAHDLDAISAMHAPGMVFANHTAGESAEGEAVPDHIGKIFETWPDIRFEGRRTYVREGLVVQEWTATATHANRMTRGDLVAEPTGRTIIWDGLDVIPFEHGLVKRKDVYSDSVSILRQVGLLD